jgi:D-aminopeptidase
MIIKIVLSIEVETNKTIKEVEKAIMRGIYRGLDTEPYNIAPPKDVKIEFNYDN